MRELLRWGLPGLVLAGPLHLFLARLHVAPRPAFWLIAAPVVGFVIQQLVRLRFEVGERGFRSPHRAALAEIIARGQLEQRSDRGDLAYQVYEVVLYQHSELRDACDHEHRARDVHFLCWSTAVACAAGALLALLGIGAQPALALLYVLALPCAGGVLYRKGQETLTTLELFDAALVRANWPLYGATLQTMTEAEPASPQTLRSASPQAS
jgi:hypothetical protein